MTKTHCIFCHQNFFGVLRPVLGFATARACEDCQQKFAKQTEKTVQDIRRECRRERSVDTVIGVVVWAVMLAVVIPLALVFVVADKVSRRA